jgi:hypothetical protein
MTKILDSIFNFGGMKSDIVTTETQLTADAARICLNVKEFKAYKAQYEQMEAKVIDELIKEAANFCVSGDSTERFGSKCLVKLTRLRDLRSLITKVNADVMKANKEKQDGD